MGVPGKQIAPETVALARKRYAEGVAVSRILGETEMSLGTLYAALDGKLDEGGGAKPAPMARRRVVMGQRKRALRAARISLVARLWRTAERQVRDIETRLASAAPDPAERERDARVLAVLVKTLRELHAFDGANLRGKVEAESDNDDSVRDLDEFRRELARKIDRLAAQHSQAGDRGVRST